MIMVLGSPNPNAQVGLNGPAWWMAFALAIVSVSMVFETFKVFSLTPQPGTVFPMVGALVLFASSLALLVYDGYAKDKAKGKVVKHFAPFDWLYAQQGGIACSEQQGDRPRED